jgi:hypothetical protein
MLATFKTFAGSRAKIERAFHHLRSIEDSLSRYWATEFCSISIYKHKGRNFIRMNTATPPPSDLALQIGDVVHNLRASFDHALTELLGTNTRLTFPLSKTLGDLTRTEAYRFLLQENEKLANYILTTLRPVEGGPFFIWEIAQLDNVDKHRMLTPIFAITAVTGVSVESDSKRFSMSDCTFRVAGDGQLHAAEWPDDDPLTVTSYGKAQADMFFTRDSAVFADRPVLLTLIELAHSAVKAMEGLEANSLDGR